MTEKKEEKDWSWRILEVGYESTGSVKMQNCASAHDSSANVPSAHVSSIGQYPLCPETQVKIVINNC